MENTQLIITPKTKVLELIEAYPHLEDVLIKYVPAFSKLKNPLLRRTVAKIATLQQAASIGNVKTGDLINLLRKEAGQELMNAADDTTYNTKKPAWFELALIEKEFDIREMLAAGEQPVNQVISDLNHLNKGKIYKLTSPFLPAPLIDKAISLKIEHWVSNDLENSVLVYFYKS
ncbi:MAG: DUF1858 domain-containing protein [Bacteroidales bacterium]|jgi:hypothetical protein